MSSGDDESYIQYSFSDSDQEIQVHTDQELFKVINLKEAGKIMKFFLFEVSSKTSIESEVCSALLAAIHWNKEKLIEKFVEFETAEKFLLAQNVLKIKSELNGINDTCIICFEESSLIILECNHNYCKDCWCAYLKNKIIREKTGLIKCMGEKCEAILPVNVIDLLLNDEIAFKEYERLVVVNFVQFNESTKFCPGKECDQIVLKSTNSEVFGVKCTCGQTFCMKCSHFEDHCPIDCKRLKQWFSNYGKDDASMRWIMKYSMKKCPKCNVIIEKDTGCNHMTCTNLGCGHQFCWMCFEKWEGHEDEGCNRPVLQEGDDELTYEPAHYSYYLAKFMAHNNSLRLEKKLTNEVFEKVSRLKMTTDFSTSNLQSLRETIQTLTECRRILMYSYVFANSIKSNNQKVIFENIQGMLEAEVGQLAHSLGHGFNFKTVAEVFEWKQNTLDSLNFITSRQAENLLKYVKEGNKLNHWDYKSS